MGGVPAAELTPAAEKGISRFEPGAMARPHGIWVDQYATILYRWKPSGLHSSQDASEIVVDRWGCDDNLLTLDVGETYRLKMVMAADLVTIYINDEPACKYHHHHRSLLRFGLRPLR